MKDKILELREEGKTYNEIKEILNCSKGTIAYHCGNGQKEKTNIRQKKRRLENPLLEKVYVFTRRAIEAKARDFQRGRENGVFNKEVNNYFKAKELLEILIENPYCYLTGRKIDLENTSSYNLDHIIPVSKGGGKELSNLGLATKEANRSKGDLMIKDYIELCKDVLIKNGYTITKASIR